MKGSEYCEWDAYRDQPGSPKERVFRRIEVGVFERVRWGLLYSTRDEAVYYHDPVIKLKSTLLRAIYRRLANHMNLHTDENEGVWHGLPEFVSNKTIEQAKGETLAPRGSLVGDYQRNALLIGRFKGDWRRSGAHWFCAFPLAARTGKKFSVEFTQKY